MNFADTCASVHWLGPNRSEVKLFESRGDLFNRLHARRFHLPASDASYGVVMDAGEFRDRGPGASTLVRGESLENVIEFHPTDYADTPYRRQALTPRWFPHHAWMKEPDEKPQLLTAQINLRNLIKGEKLSVNAFATKYDLVQSTVNRIVTGKMDPTTATLQEISDALARKGVSVHPWQFLAPDFGEGLHHLRVDAKGVTMAIPVPKVELAPLEKREEPTVVRNIPTKQDSGQRPQSSPSARTQPIQKASPKKGGV